MTTCLMMSVCISDPIKILLRPEKSYRVDRESLLSLAVDAVTDPALNLRYRWRFTDSNNITINVANSASWMLSNDNKNLTINTQGLDKEEFFRIIGRYTVEVYHSYDAEFVHIDVVTNVLTSKYIHVPTSKGLWVLERSYVCYDVVYRHLLVTLCLVHCSTCIWKFRN